MIKSELSNDDYKNSNLDTMQTFSVMQATLRGKRTLIT